MIYFAGIDGTGCEDRDEYTATFANSCIHQLAKKVIVPFDDTYYHRGPTIKGDETFSIAQAAKNQVVTHWTLGKAKAIFLGGYSRGGAAAIEVAVWLKELNIPVECLILFDAVDRCTGVGGVIYNTPIPSNVKQTIHAMRNISSTLSRVTFGRCGVTQEDASMPNDQAYFFATHGGLGGVPWQKATLPETEVPNPSGFIWEPGELTPTLVTPASDSAGAATVKSWAYPRIIQAFSECKRDLQQPATVQPPMPGVPIPGIPGQPGGGLPGSGVPGGSLPVGGQPRIHIVKPGDWLSKIAITYYGDMNKWRLIYQHNQHQIEHPDRIYPGQRLIIP